VYTVHITSHRNYTVLYCYLVNSVE